MYFVPLATSYHRSPVPRFEQAYHTDGTRLEDFNGVRMCGAISF